MLYSRKKDIKIIEMSQVVRVYLGCICYIISLINISAFNIDFNQTTKALVISIQLFLILVALICVHLWL